MPHIALARMVHGSEGYRPAGTDSLDSFWSIIDLRPPGAAEGWCLVGSQEPVPGSVMIGDDPARDHPEGRRRLQNRLGVNVSGKHLGRQILGLMLDGKDDGRRWRPLKPATKGGKRYEVWLGGERLDMVPFVAGGAVSDDFNRADASTFGSGWTQSGGTFRIRSNQAEIGGTGGALHNTPLGSPNMQVDIELRAVSSGFHMGVVGRINASGTQGYFARQRDDAAQRRWLVRISNLYSTTGGHGTLLTAEAFQRTFVGERFGVRCDGSSISFVVDDVVEPPGTVTDTTYPTGNYHGLRADFNYTPTGRRWDDYLAKALSGGPSVGFLAI